MKTDLSQVSFDQISQLFNQGNLDNFIEENPEFKNGYINSVLLCAIEKNDDKLVTFLIQKGGDIYFENQFYEPLFRFLRFDDISRSRLNLENHRKIFLTPFLFAIIYKKFNMIKLLIEAGVDINAVNNEGISGLHLACSFGYLEVVNFLIAHGADYEAIDKCGVSCFMYACMGGNVAILKKLIALDETKINVNNLGKGLHIACLNSKYEMIKFLFALGADVNFLVNNNGVLDIAITKDDEKLIDILFEYKADFTSKNLLDRAISLNYIEVAKKLLLYGANVNYSSFLTLPQILVEILQPENIAKRDEDIKQKSMIRDDNLREIKIVDEQQLQQFWLDAKKIKSKILNKRAQTDLNKKKLFKLLQEQDVEALKDLIDKAAIGVNIFNDNGELFFNLALKSNNPKIIELFEKSANLYLSLNQALRSGDIKLVNYLINQYKLDLNMLFAGHNLLHNAVIQGHFELVDLLIKYDADIDSVNKYGQNILHLAAIYNQEAMVKFLFDNYPKLDCYSLTGGMPIHYACHAGHLNIVEKLVSYGVDFEILTRKRSKKSKILFLEDNIIADMTAIRIAFDCNHFMIIEFLAKFIDVNSFFLNEYTLLHIACFRNNIKMAKLLISIGADVNIVFKDKMQTPLQVALEKKFYDLAELLIKYGANYNLIANDSFASPPKYLIDKYFREEKFEAVKILFKWGADINWELFKESTKKNKIKFFDYLNTAAAITERNRNLYLYHSLRQENILQIQNIQEQKFLKERSLFEAINSADFKAIENLVRHQKVNINCVSKDHNQIPLSYALSLNLNEVANFLINLGANINYALKFAMQNNNEDSLIFLLKNGANIEITFGGKSLLTIAVKCNYEKLVDFLYERNVDVNKHSSNQMPAIYYAVENGNHALIRKLHQYGAKIDFVLKVGYDQKSLLQAAYDNRDFTAIKLLIELGVDMDALVFGDKSLLSKFFDELAERGNVDLLDKLIKLGVDIEVKDNWGNDLLTRAIKSKKFELVEYFIKSGFEVSQLKININKSFLKFLESKKTRSDFNYYNEFVFLFNYGLLADDLIEKILEKICTAEINIELLKFAFDYGYSLNFFDDSFIEKYLRKKYSLFGNSDVDKLPELKQFFLDPENIKIRDENLKDKISKRSENIANYQDKFQQRKNFQKNIIAAIKNADLNNFNKLLSTNDFDINFISDSGDNPLLSALENDQPLMIDGLKKYDVNPNVTLKQLVRQDKEYLLEALIGQDFKIKLRFNELHSNKSLLHIASCHKSLKTIEALVKKYNFDINLINSKKMTALCYAAKNNDFETVKFLMSLGAKINISNPIRFAALNNNIEMLSFLFDHGASIIDPFEYYEPYLLTLCAQKNYYQIIDFLVKKGFDVNFDGFIGSPIFAAVDNNCKETLQVLITNGANVNFRKSLHENLLIRAVRSRSYSVIEDLVKAKVNINEIVESFGLSCIASAIENDDSKMIELLIANGADPNLKIYTRLPNDLPNDDNKFGYGTFIEMVLKKSFVDPEVLRVLIEGGAKFSQCYTCPLYIILQKPLFPEDRSQTCDELLKILIENGYDINAEINFKSINSSHNPTYPLDFFCRFAKYNDNDPRGDHYEMILALIRNGADINKLNHRQYSALHECCFNGYVEGVKILLDNQANPRLFGDNGLTPLHLAICYGHQKIISEFFQRGHSYQIQDINNLIRIIDQNMKKKASNFMFESVILEMNDENYREFLSFFMRFDLGSFIQCLNDENLLCFYNLIALEVRSNRMHDNDDQLFHQINDELMSRNLALGDGNNYLRDKFQLIQRFQDLYFEQNQNFDLKDLRIMELALSKINHLDQSQLSLELNLLDLADFLLIALDQEKHPYIYDALSGIIKTRSKPQHIVMREGFVNNYSLKDEKIFFLKEIKKKMINCADFSDQDIVQALWLITPNLSLKKFRNILLASKNFFEAKGILELKDDIMKYLLPTDEKLPSSIFLLSDDDKSKRFVSILSAQFTGGKKTATAVSV